MSDTIWVVSRGEYSDYSVLCACPTKKDAEKLAQRIRQPEPNSFSYDRDARVEELPMLTGAAEPKEVLHLTETVWDDGTTEKHIERTRLEWPWTTSGTPRVAWRWVRAPMHNGRGGRLEVHGVDHRAVRRTFSDRRAQLLAEDAFRLRKEARGGRP